MNLSNFENSLNHLSSSIGFEEVLWEQRENYQQIVTKETYPVEQAEEIANLIRITLQLKETEINTVKSRFLEGHRVLIKNVKKTFEAATELYQRIDDLRNIMDLPKVTEKVTQHEESEIQTLLTQLCQSCWSGKNYINGEKFKKKYSSITPCRQIKLETLKEGESYLLTTESFYDRMGDEDSEWQKKEVLFLADIKFIIDVLKNSTFRKIS